MTKCFVMIAANNEAPGLWNYSLFYLSSRSSHLFGRSMAENEMLRTWQRIPIDIMNATPVKQCRKCVGGHLFGTALPSQFYNLMYTRAIPLHRQRRSQPRCFTLWAAHNPWQTLIKNPFDGPNESLSVSPISY